MAAIITEPGTAIRQLSANDPEGRPVLCVLAKRSYRLAGTALFAEAEFPPLVEEPVFSEDGALLEADTDLFPYKPASDVIVKGAAYNYGSLGPGTSEAGLAIGPYRHLLLVSGDRRALLSGTQTLIFSAPEPFERMPLTYARAYGGRDSVAERNAGFPWPGVFPEVIPSSEADPADTSPFRYPRNPAGRGYLLEASREAVEQCLLPNVEDRYDPLTPERLLVRDVLHWPRQPLPASMDWMSYEWFPRIGCMGIVPSFEPGPTPFPEVMRGLMPAEVVDPQQQTTEKAFRFTCGASLGMQFPHLRGGELLRLGNLSPRGPTESWTLPPAPRLFTDGRQGRLNPAEPVVHTLVLEPDVGRLTVVWRGAAPALRHYLPDELPKMPLRVEWYD